MQQFKSDCVFGATILKVVVIEREVKALALLFARGKCGMFTHSLLGIGRYNSNLTVLLGRLFLR